MDRYRIFSLIPAAKSFPQLRNTGITLISMPFRFGNFGSHLFSDRHMGWQIRTTDSEIDNRLSLLAQLSHLSQFCREIILLYRMYSLCGFKLLSDQIVYILHYLLN